MNAKDFWIKRASLTDFGRSTGHPLNLKAPSVRMNVISAAENIEEMEGQSLAVDDPSGWHNMRGKLRTTFGEKYPISVRTGISTSRQSQYYLLHSYISCLAEMCRYIGLPVSRSL